jgi:hypothetical protein
MRKLRKASGCAALVAAITTGLQLATAPPVAAIDGWEIRAEISRFNNSIIRGREPYKVAVAFCSNPGKRVVGGGAVINEEFNRKDARLVWLAPFGSTGFIAAAEYPHLAELHNWSLTAYAICVDGDAVPRHQIVSNVVDVPSTGGPFRHTAARCPSGTIAYGAGGQVSSQEAQRRSQADGAIGLQLNRTSGPQDISRVSAREQEEGYFGRWRLTSYAICADPPSGMNVRTVVTGGDEARTFCDNGWDVIGPGGGGGLSDGGPAWLHQISPFLGRKEPDSVIVKMTRPPLGGMVAHTTCAR